MSEHQMPMKTKRGLTELVNIGTKIAGRLNEAGIHSEEDLRRIGPAEAHRRIKALYPRETISVCYYLYSFEGALTGKHWDKISAQRKKTLRNEIGRK